MPFVAKHVRITNSGKLPDIFLTSKIQSPTDLADAKLGKLFFVLQINSPWSHAATIGSSVINTISREYYRQEGHVPLENFERAVAKANRLIEQLAREGESNIQENLHAIIALAVGDELHITYAGEAEAYFLRDDKLSQILEPSTHKKDKDQAFNNIITGEVSAADTILLGSPGLYSATTTELLQTYLNQPVIDAAKAIARQLKSAKIRKANAIVIRFDTLSQIESQPLTDNTDTLYLDQAIDSTWQIISYNLVKIGRPIGRALTVLGNIIAKGAQKAQKRTSEATQNTVLPKAQQLLDKTQTVSGETINSLGKRTSGQFSKLGDTLSKLKKPSFTLPQLTPEEDLSGVSVNHYGRRRHNTWYIKAFNYPLGIIQDLGKQFRKAIRRNPRTWYIVIALILLASIGASVQSRKNKPIINPVVPTASLEEMKSVLTEAKQAKAYGNNDKARQLLSQAITKGEVAKQNPKLTAEASALLSQAQHDLDTLANATRLTADKPLSSLRNQPTQGVIFEGVLYYPTSDGKLLSSLLTGGEATTLAQIPGGQAVNQLTMDTGSKTLYLQSYSGDIYTYDINTKKFKPASLSEGEFTVSTGLATFGGTLYLLDPADSQIWKHSIDDANFGKATAYLKNNKTNLDDTVSLAIDGSVFALHKNGQVSKFIRGNAADFSLNGLPVPFNTIPAPITFAAVEDGTSYYLADRGNGTIPSRIIEFDKSGKFVHQFFLPTKWQKDIKLVIGNPKSHKVWVLVNKDLYEFTLVQ